jgi:hypothetical protein
MNKHESPQQRPRPSHQAKENHGTKDEKDKKNPDPRDQMESQQSQRQMKKKTT